MPTATAICLAESHGNYLATDYDSNGTTDYGIMQINSIHADMVNGNLKTLYDPNINMQVAHKLWLAKGWYPWTSYITGYYKNF